METAPNTGYPYFTPGSGGNSAVFNEGPGGLLALPNPFTITFRCEAWRVRASLVYNSQYYEILLLFCCILGKDTVLH